MSLHYIQVKIIKFVSKNNSQDIDEKFLSKNLSLNKKIIHYHLDLLAKEDFITSALEINNCGFEKHLCIEIADKGEIYLENLNYLDAKKEKLYSKFNSYPFDMKKNFKLIINFINKNKLDSDLDIAKGLNIDLESIRYYLKLMAEYKLIDLIKGETFNGSFYNVTKITPKGQLFTRGDIDFDNFSSPNNQKTINVNNGNYNESIGGNYLEQSHSGSGDNVARDKNTTNIYNSQDLTQAAADIKALLEQLDKIYDASKTTGKMTIATQAIETIDNDTNLTQRIISALKTGSISALESLLDHPAASFFIAALEDWQQTKK